jgi:hypothetical protein
VTEHNAEYEALALGEIRERLESLRSECDEANADADRQIAGMREVALMRAMNAKCLMGNLALPLLVYAERLNALLRAECWTHHSNEGPHGIRYEPSPCQVAKRAAHIGRNANA